MPNIFVPSSSVKYKTFLENFLKKYDLSFNVHLTTRQRINTSEDTACVAGILTRYEFTQSPTPVFVLHSMRNRRDKNGSNKVRRQIYYYVMS